jgi:hypothetical protein
MTFVRNIQIWPFLSTIEAPDLLYQMIQIYSMFEGSFLKTSVRLAIALCLILNTSDSMAQSMSDRPIIHDLNAALTDVMIVDGFNPPLASRTYLYCNVGFYEVIMQTSDLHVSLAGQLNQLTDIPSADSAVDLELAAVFVFKFIGNKLVYSTEIFGRTTDELVERASQGLDENTVRHSKDYAKIVFEHLNRWIGADNYHSMRAMARYLVLKEDWSWEPTPPAYQDALEPNWFHLRPMTLDSSGQFLPVSHIPFDTARTSEFFAQALHVKQTVDALSDDQLIIAKFWDCSPLQTRIEGHFKFSAKQMTPGGHWIAITGIACSEKKLDLVETSSVYTNVAIGLYDGFITSWKAKYIYNLIRPETYINRYIDPNWRPILETPPFPEYTSGHSVISMCSAEILNARLGELTFVDTVETRWGYPARTFHSFIDAALEVSDSRVYGGIHYRMGVDMGIWQGRMLGGHIIGRIRFRRD